MRGQRLGQALVRGQLSRLSTPRERHGSTLLGEFLCFSRSPQVPSSNNYGSVRACKCSNRLTFKRHLKQMTGGRRVSAHSAAFFLLLLYHGFHCFKCRLEKTTKKKRALRCYSDGVLLKRATSSLSAQSSSKPSIPACSLPPFLLSDDSLCTDLTFLSAH